MYFNNKISLVLQEHQIRSRFPDAKVEMASSNGKNSKGRMKNILVIELWLQPTSNSRKYRCKFVLKDGNPDIWVHGLQNLESSEFPHIYERNIKKNKAIICLFYPPKNEWNRTMLVVNTLIPWTLEWLLHYEIWLLTGCWTGGGREGHEK